MRKWRSILVAIPLFTLATFGLIGCDDKPAPTSIEQGKECYESGGVWNWSEWSGYHCEFGVEE